MILKGNEDLRVVKTIEGIKTAFEELIAEKDYGNITVKELCDRARINKKTFYHYYETLDSLLFEMKTEISAAFVERMKDFILPAELDKVIKEFFRYSVQQGPAYEKITCSGTFSFARDELMRGVNEGGWENSEQYQKLSDYEKILVAGFVNSTVLTAYRKWIEDGKRMSIEDVSTMTIRIVLNGINGVFS